MKKWQGMGLVAMTGVSSLVIISWIHNLSRQKAGQDCQLIFGFTPSYPLSEGQVDEIFREVCRARQEVDERASQAGTPVGSASYEKNELISFMLASSEYLFKMRVNAAKRVFYHFAENPHVLIEDINILANPVISRRAT